MSNFMKKQKGITLIALVITIIVLLILAGIAISMLSGENGILRQAGKAKTDTEVAQKKEESTLTSMEMNVEKFENNLPYNFIPGDSDVYITGITIESISAELVSEFKTKTNNKYTVWTTDSDGKEKEAADTAKIGTGMVMKKTSGEKVGTFVVFGDIDGDGVIEMEDASKVYNLTNDSKEYVKYAADCDFNGFINLEDAQLIHSNYAQTYSINQNTTPKSTVVVETTQEHYGRLIKRIGIEDKIVRQEWYEYYDEDEEETVCYYNIYINQNASEDPLTIEDCIAKNSDDFKVIVKRNGKTQTTGPIQDGDTIQIRTYVEGKQAVIFDRQVATFKINQQ